VVEPPHFDQDNIETDWQSELTARKFQFGGRLGLVNWQSIFVRLDLRDDQVLPVNPLVRMLHQQRDLPLERDSRASSS
jgi:hypothetical protein